MRTSLPKARPKYLDLLKIKLPITGVVSIAHRLSGVLLVLSLPLWLFFLDLSLKDTSSYNLVAGKLDNFFFKMLVIIGFWALIHHFFAGIRYLLIDIGIGESKQSAISMSKLVFAAEAVVMLFIIGWLI